MKFRGTKLSKRTIALLAAAVILFAGGGTMETRAALTATSDDYDATIELDQIAIALTENGKIVTDGTLFSSLSGKTFSPGMTYEDSVGVENTGSAPEYVRVIVRKYWTDDNPGARSIADRTCDIRQVDC